MQLTIEHVEHITLQLGQAPSPLSGFIASLLSGKGMEGGIAKNPTNAGEFAGVQTTAQTAKPVLKIGEHYTPAGGMYAGISRGEDGQPDGHMFLLDVKPESTLKWVDAVAWGEAFGDGARLPTKTESALLYANLKDQFDEEWHWTGTQYSDHNAWLQGFSYGYQDNLIKTYEGRARAVRRLIL